MKIKLNIFLSIILLIISGAVLGFSVLIGVHYLFFAFLLIVIYTLFLNIETKFHIVVLVSLFPLGIASIAGKGILAIEIIAPIFFASILLKTVKEKKPVFPKSIRIQLFILFCFLTSVSYHYISNPVSAEVFGTYSEYSRGLRDYYKIFVGVLVYFSSLWLFAYQDQESESWIGKIILISILLGFARLASFFFHFDMPLFIDAFQYAEDASARFGGLTYRIGGIDTISIVGFAAFIAYYHKKNITFGGILSFVVLLIILILGGGRTSFWGLIFAFVTYFIFLNKKYFLPFVYGMAFIIATYYSVTVLFNAPNQFERLLAISESDKIVDDYRSETYEFYWNSFKENPIFGKGIGFVSLDVTNKEFVLQQLKAGGHGAYLSILAIFGLAGGAFLSTFLFGTIFMGFRNIKRYYSQSSLIDQERLILFTLFYLTTISVYYLTSFSGFNDMSLYFMSGIICGFTVKYQNIVKVSA